MSPGDRGVGVVRRPGVDERRHVEVADRPVGTAYDLQLLAGVVAGDADDAAVDDARRCTSPPPRGSATRRVPFIANTNGVFPQCQTPRTSASCSGTAAVGPTPGRDGGLAALELVEQVDDQVRGHQPGGRVGEHHGAGATRCGRRSSRRGSRASSPCGRPASPSRPPGAGSRGRGRSPARRPGRPDCGCEADSSSSRPSTSGCPDEQEGVLGREVRERGPHLAGRGHRAGVGGRLVRRASRRRGARSGPGRPRRPAGTTCGSCRAARGSGSGRTPTRSPPCSRATTSPSSAKPRLE